MSWLSKVSDSTGFCVPPVVSALGSVAVADAGGGGGGSTAFVCMVPAKTDRDSTKSKVVAAQSRWNFFINVLLKGRLVVCKGVAKCRARTQALRS